MPGKNPKTFTVVENGALCDRNINMVCILSIKKVANLILLYCARLEILGFNHLALVEPTPYITLYNFAKSVRFSAVDMNSQDKDLQRVIICSII